MNYVRYPVNINGLKLKDISIRTHPGVKFWQSLVSSSKEMAWSKRALSWKPSFWGQPLFKRHVPIWQRVGIVLNVKGVASSLWAGCFSKFPSGHSFSIVCTKQCKSWEGVDIRMQKQKLHCWFQTVLSWESTHLCRHPTVDKVRICWMEARGQRQVVNYLGQWKMSFLENLWKPIAPEFAWK